MRSPIHMLQSLCILLALALLISASGAQPRPNDGVLVSLSLPDSRLTLHEPIILTFDVKNNTSAAVYLDLGRDRKGNFLFTVTQPTGLKVQLPQLTKSGFTRPGVYTLEPGQSYSQQLLLNEWGEFSGTGSYAIEARLAKPILGADNRPLAVDEVLRIRFEVTPRNESILTKTCESLANRIEAFSSYENSAEAALALSYVADPIAVPYLRRALLAKKLVEPLAIRGLERIANLDAVQALGSALGIQYNDTSVLAQAALQRIEARTSDPELRQEIIRTLTRSDAPSS